MVNKVSDFIYNIFSAKEKSSTNVPGMPNVELTARQRRAMQEAADELRGLAEQIINTQKEIARLNKVITDNVNVVEVATAKRQKETALYDLDNKYDAMDAKQKDMERRHGISHEAMNSWNDALLAMDENQSKYFSQAEISFGSLDAFFKEGMGAMGGVAKNIKGVAELFGFALDQIIALNDELIKFNRRMSQSITATSIGFSNMGNGGFGMQNIGSVNAITSQNGVGVSEFLDSFQAFQKGNIIGLSDKLQESAGALQDYGLTAAKLTKQFSVDATTLGTLTSSLLYNYGMKIEDINKILKDGTDIAAANGVAVSAFFKNLSEASNLSGQIYISKGTAGLEKMAFLATKLNVSISDMAGFASKYQDYNSLYQRQNLASALGMWQVGKNTARIWADIRVGKVGEAFQEYITSAAKDLKRNNYIDDKGQVDFRGIQSLNAIGATQEEIKAIQNLTRAQKETGATFEELTGQVQANLMTQIAMENFQRKNLTIAERFGQLWDKVKALVIDPIASILGPILDVSLTALSDALDILLFFLKPVVWGFQAIGTVLQYVADAFGWVGSVVRKVFDMFSTNFPGLTSVIKGLTGAVGLAVAAMITYTAATRAAALAQGFSSGTGALGKIGNLIMGTASNAPLLNAGTRIGGLFGQGGVLTGLGARATGFLGLGQGGALSGLGTRAAGLGGNLLSGGRSLLSSAGGFLNGGTLVGGLVRGGLISAGGSIISSMLGKAVGGKAGNTVSTVGSLASTGAGIGLMFGPIGAAVGGLIGGAVGIVKSSWGDIKKVWSDDSKGIFGKIIGTFGAIGNTIGEMFKGIWDWGKSLFSDDVKNEAADRAKAEKVHDNAMVTMNEIIHQREDTSKRIAEKSQEKQMQNNFHFKVTTDFAGASKARIGSMK